MWIHGDCNREHSMKRSASALFSAALCLCAIPVTGQDANATFVGAHGATMPASYRGSLEDNDWHLDLWPDQDFHLLRTPQGDGQPTAIAGRWHATGHTLVLDLNGETIPLEVRHPDRLRPKGASDDSGDDLVGGQGLDPLTLRLPVSGMFTYYADAPSIVHCETGRTYPVIQEGSYLELERAYLEDRPGPAEPLFVTMDATIAMRTQMEGADRLSVTAEDFHATWPGENCIRAAASPDLSGTVWRIATIGGTKVDWSAREPFLVLDRSDVRFNASVGCNTLLGKYSDVDGLSFDPPASTMMACPDDLAAHETNLAKALEATSRHEIGGRTLRLVDDAGRVTMELEAVYLP